MMGLAVLLRKEIKEQFRTNKVIIVAIVFLLFALMSPAMIKYLPDLMNALPETEGIVIDMPPAVSGDALVSYASNISQFGVLIAILVAMGAIAKEIESGTAA
ncbi:MAG: ABC transporter permease subunit [Dehalococcoidia bacterium]|nr:ABC transporter permease subunit [Dehalococcoidia bacterium]